MELFQTCTERLATGHWPRQHGVDQEIGMPCAVTLDGKLCLRPKPDPVDTPTHEIADRFSDGMGHTHTGGSL